MAYAVRAALENSAESFGENDSRTKNWQIQLNNAQAILNGLEGELEANNKALDQMGEQADDAGGDGASVQYSCPCLHGSDAVLLVRVRLKRGLTVPLDAAGKGHSAA